MAFDGITVAGVTAELNKYLPGSRLYKIAQPEEDELILTFKTSDSQYRVVLSASASLPLVYFTSTNKPSPMNAPNFCMLLRKHIQNGRVISITQPGLERIITFTIEHLDEMGDIRRKKIIVEIMGKHSNIIFTDENDVILDSIKRVSAAVSSVREVLPGRKYFMVKTDEKQELLNGISKEKFISALKDKPMPVYKALYSAYTGLSPIISHEICYRAKLDGDASTASLTESDLDRLYGVLHDLKSIMESKNFSPEIVYEGKKPVEFSAVGLKMYSDNSNDKVMRFDSISEAIEAFYAERDADARIKQRSTDLRKIVSNALERNVKKYDLQLKQIKDTEKRDIYRVYGELLNTYGYSSKPGDKKLKCLNYHTNEEIEIPLDPQLTATENAKKYFDKYNKYKRTYEALSELTREVKSEIEHLETVQNALDIATNEADLLQIKEELIATGYIKFKVSGKKTKMNPKPFHYVSSDGFDIYVGKNNLQNDELTFKFANSNDWWFHAKKMPGSHVVVRLKNTGDMPDKTFEEAAALAAFYSKGRAQEKVEIDYVRRKEVKKPNGAKPGFVVYYTNFSMAVVPDISNIKLVTE